MDHSVIRRNLSKDSSKICRLCLGKEVKLTRPFKDDAGPNEALLQKIYECTTVKITLKATYPAAICAICDTKLLEYSKFRARCIENDEILRLLLDDIADAAAKEPSPSPSSLDDDAIEPIDVKESEEFKDLQLQLYGSSDETTVSQSEFAGTDGGASSSTEAAVSPLPKIVKITSRAAPESTKDGPVVVTRPTISVKPISSLAAISSPPSEPPQNALATANPNAKDVNGVPAVVGADGRLECVICARPFRNTYTLKRHMNLHTEENLFTCEYCGKKFNDRSNWKIHLRAHTGDNLLRCAVCFKTFISPSTLKYHLRAHRKLQVFECRFCAETYESYDLLADHVNAKHGDIRLDELGGKGDDSFIAGDFLKIEMEADETTLTGMDGDMEEPMPEPPPLIPAPTVRKVTRAHPPPPAEVEEPAVKIKEEIVDVDEIDIKQEPVDDTLEPDPDGRAVRQLESILPPPEEEAPPVILFRCDYCMKIFKYLYELRVHMKIHNGSKLPGASGGASSANKSTDKASPSTTLVLASDDSVPPPAKRVRHPSIDEDVAELANAPQPEHECSKCDKCFRTEELLKVHIETHKRDEDITQARSCKVCFKTFKCELNLVSHIKKHHLYESYVTEQQQQSGSTASESSPSAESSTVNDKPASPDSSSNDGTGGNADSGAEGSTSGGDRRCEICALTFNCPYKLEKHVLTHFKNNEAVAFVPSADRPYKCTECHKRFKRKDYLLIHIRTHTGERRHKCDLCSSAFVHPSNLITHRKLHSNERPFKCDLCSAAFKLYAGLKIHRKRCVLKYLQENSVTSV